MRVPALPFLLRDSIHPDPGRDADFEDDQAAALSGCANEPVIACGRMRTSPARLQK